MHKHESSFRHTAIILAGLAIVSGAAALPGASGFDLSWHTIDGGGGTSFGSGYTLSGTMGQPDAGGPLVAGEFSLVGGFWAGPGEVGLPCSGDVNGSGAVDVDDLIAVVLAWGCVNPPGPCPADANGDGMVNVDDLIAVILAWGPCP
jgi:hypothetical protein